jgi:hypothetical protein
MPEVPDFHEEPGRILRSQADANEIGVSPKEAPTLQEHVTESESLDL